MLPHRASPYWCDVNHTMFFMLFLVLVWCQSHNAHYAVPRTGVMPITQCSLCCSSYWCNANHTMLFMLFPVLVWCKSHNALYVVPRTCVMLVTQCSFVVVICCRGAVVILHWLWFYQMPQSKFCDLLIWLSCSSMRLFSDKLEVHDSDKVSLQILRSKASP